MNPSPTTPPRGKRRARLALRPLRLRRVRPLVAATVLVLGLAVTLPSCRAAARLGLFRGTPPAADEEAPDVLAERIMADPNIVWNCTSEGLDENLLVALGKVAADYASRTGQPIVVNSGARTLRRQAELMADMSQGQLEGMYCRQGYPAYVASIAEARRRDRGAVDAEAVYEILRQRDDGFISSHLFGAAVDVSPSGADVELLRTLLEENGFTTLDERGLGINCLHSTYRAVPRRIVRE
jgi:hypothetical protein